MSTYANYELLATGKNLLQFKEGILKIFDDHTYDDELEDGTFMVGGMYNINWDWREEVKELCDQTQTTISIHWLCNDGMPHESWESSYDPAEDEEPYDTSSEHPDIVNTITIVSEGTNADALAFYLYTMLREDEEYSVSNIHLAGKTITFDSESQFELHEVVYNFDNPLSLFAGIKIEHRWTLEQNGNRVVDEWEEEVQEFIVDEDGGVYDC